MRRLLATAIAAVAVLAAALVAAPASAQQGDGIRVIARKLDSGFVELGVRQDGRDRLPEYRFFDYAVEPVGEWLETGPVRVNAPWGSVEVVVIVRRTAAGRVEIGLDTYDTNFTVRIEGAHSFDHAAAPVGRWLRSGPAVLTRQHASEMLPIEDTEPVSPSEPAVVSWPPPTPTRPAPWPPPASAFWPAGTCALGPRHDSGGDILFCTPPTATDLRTHLNGFVAMLAPWYPWIGAALEWAGGYRIVHSSETPCSRGSSGCAAIEGHDVDVYVVGDIVVRMARSEWGEVLIHELAHAFDHMRWFAHNEYPSTRFLTKYPQGLRFELFADALAANTIGEAAATRRYNGTGDVPDQPPLADLLTVAEAVIEWCPISQCGAPRVAREIMWAPLRQSTPQQPALRDQQPAQTNTNAECLARVRELRVAHSRARNAHIAAWGAALYANSDARIARMLADETGYGPHVAEAERLEAEADRLNAEVDRLKAEADQLLAEMGKVRC